MHMGISGKQINIGASLQEHVKERLEKVVKKYFERAVSAEVVFSRQAHFFHADIHVNEGTGTLPLIKSSGHNDDIYAAFDSALVKMEKQLRRYKERIKKHHKAKLNEALPVDQNAARQGTKYIITPASLNEDHDYNEHEHDNPVIIAEKPTHIESLSVSEAVMRMDLAGLPALMFFNTKTKRLNVVYHRADGNISWVDPGE